MKQQKDETAFEFLNRVIDWLGNEKSSLVEDLPTVEAVMDYAELWTVYGIDFMEGIEEMIEHHGADPKPLRDFVKKHKLNWDLSWTRKTTTKGT